MSLLDVLLLGLLGLWLAASLLWMHRRHKRGKCIGCGGDCAHCVHRK